MPPSSWFQRNIFGTFDAFGWGIHRISSLWAVRENCSEALRLCWLCSSGRQGASDRKRLPGPFRTLQGQRLLVEHQAPRSGLLDRAAAQCHRIRVAAQSFPHGVDQRLMLPAGDPALRAGGATAFHGAGLAAVDPIPADLQAPFLTGIAIDEFVADRAGVDVAGRVIEEIGLHEPPLGRIGRGRGTRHRRGDARAVARQDFGAAEIPLVREDVQIFTTQGGFGGDRHRAELISVETLIGDLMRDDQMGLGVDRALHVIADHAAVPGDFAPSRGRRDRSGKSGHLARQ